MLFEADELLQPAAQLEINLVLPAEIAGLSSTEVVCRGEVVRTVQSHGEAVSPALAARILQYHFQHGPLPKRRERFALRTWRVLSDLCG